MKVVGRRFRETPFRQEPDDLGKKGVYVFRLSLTLKHKKKETVPTDHVTPLYFGSRERLLPCCGSDLSVNLSGCPTPTRTLE